MLPGQPCWQSPIMAVGMRDHQHSQSHKPSQTNTYKEVRTGIQIPISLAELRDIEGV